MMNFPAFKFSNAVFIMLINVKLPTIVGHFNIYEHDKFHDQLSMKNISSIAVSINSTFPCENLKFLVPLSMQISTIHNKLTL